MGITAARYSQTVIILHWLIALLVVINFAGGATMANLSDSADPAMKALAGTINPMHKSTGLLILVLSVVRVAVRLLKGAPPFPSSMGVIERLLAGLVQWGFYIVLILLPFSGWLMNSASPRGQPISWYGLFDWPLLPIERNVELATNAHAAHGVLAFVLLAMFVLHVLAALKHQFFDRDDIMARIRPSGR